MPPGPIGIVANPASGKDIRRLVAHASVFDNNEKRNMVARALYGAIAAGATDFVYMPTPAALVESCVEGLDEDISLRPVEVPWTDSALDTTRAAARMREAGCVVVITFGGDGTNRAFAKGWLDAPLVPISTGTNNVFPMMFEATVAGAAAGLVATGAVSIDEASAPAKRIRVSMDDATEDLALIDAVLLDDPFVGARAVWRPETLRTLVLARAEPAAIGLSSIGGLLHPVGAKDDAGLLVHIGEGGPHVLAAIAPGLHREIPVREVRELALGETVILRGRGTLALDGEREITLREGEEACLQIVRDGPRVIDVPLALRLAACRGAFVINPEETANAD